MRVRFTRFSRFIFQIVCLLLWDKFRPRIRKLTQILRSEGFLWSMIPPVNGLMVVNEKIGGLYQKLITGVKPGLVLDEKKIQPKVNMINKKIAVITGGSSGIGNAVGEKLIKGDYQVVNADIRKPLAHSQADFVRCDITKAGDIAKLYDYVTSTYGIPDVLISNAGQGIHERLSEGDPEKWAKIIDINLIGALRFVRAFLPGMLDQKKDAVLFISSTAGSHAYEYGGIYAASKAALNMVAKTLKLEVSDRLRIGIISPGVVETAFFNNMIGSHHTVSDIGWGAVSPEHIADLIVFVLSLPPSVNVPEITITPTPQRP